jgi:hypothetical protein
VFTVDVILDLGGNSSIGHQVSVKFTPGLLVANAAVELGAPPYEFNIGPGVHGIDNAAGVVESFEAAAFTAITPGTPFVVGQRTPCPLTWRTETHWERVPDRWYWTRTPIVAFRNRMGDMTPSAFAAVAC